MKITKKELIRICDENNWYRKYSVRIPNELIIIQKDEFQNFINTLNKLYGGTK